MSPIVTNALNKQHHFPQPSSVLGNKVSAVHTDVCTHHTRAHTLTVFSSIWGPSHPSNLPDFLFSHSSCFHGNHKNNNNHDNKREGKACCASAERDLYLSTPGVHCPPRMLNSSQIIQSWYIPPLYGPPNCFLSLPKEKGYDHEGLRLSLGQMRWRHRRGRDEKAWAPETR